MEISIGREHLALETRHSIHSQNAPDNVPRTFEDSPELQRAEAGKKGVVFIDSNDQLSRQSSLNESPLATAFPVHQMMVNAAEHQVLQRVTSGAAGGVAAKELPVPGECSPHSHSLEGPSVEVTHYPIVPPSNPEEAPRYFLQKDSIPHTEQPLQPIQPASPSLCQCSCHHTHHHHHHHTIVINGRPDQQLPGVSCKSISSSEVKNSPRLGVLKTTSCPPWADGAPKAGRPIRNYNSNNNNDNERKIPGRGIKTIYIPINKLNNRNNNASDATAKGATDVEVSVAECRYQGPVQQNKRPCWKLSKGMIILVVTLFIIIVALLCGLVFFLVRGNAPSSDSSSHADSSGSSNIPSVTTVINQTSVCGIFPVEYLPANLRALTLYEQSHNTFPPKNDNRILQAPRIIGGKPTNVGQYPWQVSLWEKHRGMTCGGSIIMKDWILTAAHCTQSNPDPKVWTAYMGMSAISEKTKPPAQTSKILKIIQHQMYQNDFSYDYDISLMKLETPLKFTPTVQPICLPAATDVFKEGTPRCYVSGWGAMDNSGQGGSPNILQHAQVDIIGYGTCRRDDWLSTLVTDRMMCAGKVNGSADACQGDSGGPLACYNSTRKVWTLAGSVSWGIDCGLPRHPGVYTKIPVFVDWIWTSIGRSEGWIETPTEPVKMEEITPNVSTT